MTHPMPGMTVLPLFRLVVETGESPQHVVDDHELFSAMKLDKELLVNELNDARIVAQAANVEGSRLSEALTRCEALEAELSLVRDENRGLVDINAKLQDWMNSSPCKQNEDTQEEFPPPVELSSPSLLEVCCN